jgi:hypothetical protein
MRSGKWIAKGMVNGRQPQYPDRKPALKAENVIAFS